MVLNGGIQTSGRYPDIINSLLKNIFPEAILLIYIFFNDTCVGNKIAVPMIILFCQVDIYAKCILIKTFYIHVTVSRNIIYIIEL